MKRSNVLTRRREPQDDDRVDRHYCPHCGGRRAPNDGGRMDQCPTCIETARAESRAVMEARSGKEYHR